MKQPLDRITWPAAPALCALALACGCRSTPGGESPRPPIEAAAAIPAPEVLERAARQAPVAAVPPAAPGAPPAGAAPLRGVVLISIDSLRADMPWTGYPRAIAPNLASFAQRAVRYDSAYALSSYTSMSLGGLLAGRLPGEVRRDGNFFGRYPRDNVFFPETLHDGGVRTLAAHAHFYFRPGFAGFEQGFDVYQMLPGLHVDFTTDLDVTGDRHEALAETILGNGANTAGRFFAWFHFMDAHDHYLPHASVPPYGRTLRDRYDGEVTFVDQQVGRLLAFIDRQPWAAQTAVIITADHGEVFGEHRMFRHAFELWQPLVRVPLMVRLPGVAPRVIDVARSHVDVAPTVLALLGVPAPSTLRGESLREELYGAAAPARDVWIDLPETSVSRRRRALVHDHYKLIAYDADARFEVYDLAADPGELHPLPASGSPVYADMVARYRAGQGGIHDVPAYAVHYHAN